MRQCSLQWALGQVAQVRGSWGAEGQLALALTAQAQAGLVLALVALLVWQGLVLWRQGSAQVQVPSDLECGVWSAGVCIVRTTGIS